jgi:hypothetical protein
LKGDRESFKDKVKKLREECKKNWLLRPSTARTVKIEKKKPEPISPSKQRRSDIRLKSATPKTADENASATKRKRNSN